MSTPPITQPQRFPIRVGKRSRPLLLLFGVRGHNAFVDFGDNVAVTFGFFRFRTTLSNVVSWRIEGPWLWVTAIGVRMSIRHRDVSFDGSHLGGVRLDFRERVRWGPINVPAIYVTVEDLDGFSAALSERGIPGEDARRPG
jgi:hypothetical protein